MDHWFSSFENHENQEPQALESHLKKLRRAEGGAKFFGLFRVKNHDFTPKNIIFSVAEGGDCDFSSKFV
jgi:hypothetical protein